MIFGPAPKSFIITEISLFCNKNGEIIALLIERRGDYYS
jgi:hypothetical protein